MEFGEIVVVILVTIAPIVLGGLMLYGALKRHNNVKQNTKDIEHLKRENERLKNENKEK